MPILYKEEQKLFCVKILNASKKIAQTPDISLFVTKHFKDWVSVAEVSSKFIINTL